MQRFPTSFKPIMGHLKNLVGDSGATFSQPSLVKLYRDCMKRSQFYIRVKGRYAAQEANITLAVDLDRLETIDLYFQSEKLFEPSEDALKHWDHRDVHSLSAVVNGIMAEFGDFCRQEALSSFREQAEIITVAQQMADRLTLSLRSVADAQEEVSGEADYLLSGNGRSGTVRLIKSGAIGEVGARQ